MAVPGFQDLMLPVLRALSDGTEIRSSELRAKVAAAERLSPEDLAERIPSGTKTRFDDRVSWAASYMAHADLIDKPRRGVYLITKAGQDLLSKKPTQIDIRFLMSIPAFARWKGKGPVLSPGQRDESSVTVAEKYTPEELLDQAHLQLRETLEADLLERIRGEDPQFLERLIVKLLIAMGYGHGDETMGRVTGGSGDGGIDGTIQEDRLGLDTVYLQAKKYAHGNVVGVGELHKFAGALDGRGTPKGVFVTTSEFTEPAKKFATQQTSKSIVLIDGKKLASLMVEHNVGVRIKTEVQVKRIDEDFFAQDD